MSTTMIEYAAAELAGGGKTHDVQLRLTVKEMRTDESFSPVLRTVARRELMRGTAIADGLYTLRYVFNGKPEVHPVRVQYGGVGSGEPPAKRGAEPKRTRRRPGTPHPKKKRGA